MKKVQLEYSILKIYILGKNMFSLKSLFLILVISTSISNTFGYQLEEEKKRDLEFYQSTKKWFSAWKLISQDIYKIKKVQPVEFVFFDDKYVYSTSDITIKDGKLVNGSNLGNLKFVWKKALHNNSITLPEGSVIPVDLMSFAGEIPSTNKAFFVMPLPSFWKKAGVTSKELGAENLITGIFIHEFSHSQQSQNFGKKITEFEKQSNFTGEFNDDIIQTLFENDTTYLNKYKKEVYYLYDLVNKPKENKAAFKDGLASIYRRQQMYFTEKYESLKQIDNLFLTMEGLGQYSMYLWMIHQKGGNIKKEIAIEGIRRGGKWWSQDEGFVLFLLLDRFTKPRQWAQDMFGNDVISITQLLEQNL